MVIFLNQSQIFGQRVDSTSIFDNRKAPQVVTNYDKSKLDTNGINYQRSKQFYDSLKFKAQRSNLTRNLHRWIVREDKKQGTNGMDHSTKFQPYQGKIIRNINIHQLAVFGQTIYDTTLYPDKWIQKFGNSLHVNSHTGVIRNKLLFKKGDIITPLTMADNERILRGLPNIKNAIILIDPVSNYSDSVDITVITQDVWPIGFSLELFDVVYGKFGLWNNNLFGIGHELNYYGYYDLNRDPSYAYQARYRIHNIRNTFISTDLSYENQWNYKTYKLSIERQFFTPEIKYAGGVGFQNVSGLWDIHLEDTSIAETNIEYNHFDGWAGRSFHLKRFDNIQTRTNYFVTGRYQQYNYLKRPDNEIDPGTLYQFHQRNTYLISTGISKEGFYTTHLVYGFGVPEDISYGHMIKITGGFEISEFKTRPYLGFELSSGTYFPKIGYVYNKFEIGGYPNDRFEQSALFYTGKYISHLIGNGSFRFRFFNKTVFEQGFNRYDGEYLNLEPEDGIRGINSEVFGTQRLYFNNEFVAYSPHYIYGFRFVYYLFLDVGIINNRDDIIFRNPVYSSMGIGLRIRNERLVFNTIQLRLAYYPNIPEGANLEHIQLTGFPQPKPENFADKKPHILNYNYY